MCIEPITVTGNDGQEYKVPCGKCILCRKRRAQNWAIKLIKEAEYHKKMVMLTLTFDPKKLIGRASEINCDEDKYKIPNVLWAKNLIYSKLYTKLFFKKLRKHFEAGQISYFKIGEYGELHKRAHYHIIIFGIDKDDLKAKICGKSKKNKEIYYSDIIDKCWKLGLATISDVTNATIKYVANYTLKKFNQIEGKEIFLGRQMSFSNRNKIGIKWARKWHKELRKGYITDYENFKYAIPKGWKLEMDRYFRYVENPEWAKTEEIIEEKTFEHLEKLEKAGKLTNEYMKKKAKILEHKTNLLQKRLDL